MARRIATVRGYAIRPGVSRNGRLYTKEMIAGAVERAQGRLGDGIHLVDRTARVLDQRTHHAADDDSTRIVGRITRLHLTDDGSARFEADLADTEHGRTIASLIAPKGDGPDEVEPFLTGVSIRGAWVGKVRREQHDGRTVETADGLDLDGLDYTGRPGVDGAVVDDFTPAGSHPPGESDTSAERVLIFESVQEALVTTVIEEAAAPAKTKAPYGDVEYADPGYQKDKQKRYPIDTKAHAKAAWSYVNQADNARLYTSAQLKRVRGRIKAALKKFGVRISTEERWLIEPAQQVTEALAECWGMDMERPNGDLYISLTNGPTTVTVTSRLLDPHDLDLVGRAAMDGACNALLALDPDMDADIDVPGAEPEDTDMGDEDGNEPGSACSCGCGCAVPHPMAVADGCPCGCGCDVCKAQDSDEDGDGTESAATESAPQNPAEPAAETTTSEEAPVTESTTPAETTPGAPDGIQVLSDKFDKLTELLTLALAPKPAESAPAAPVTEQAAPPVTETEEQRIDRLVTERLQAQIEKSGPPTRKGYVRPVTENASASGTGTHGLPEGWPDKPLSQYTREERAMYMEPAVVATFLRGRA
jgi:hypothetical protein